MKRWRALQDGLRLASVGLALLLAAGCMSPPKRASGFLVRYYGFLPATTGSGALIYQSSKFDFSHYDRILLDDVALHFGPESNREIDPAEAQALARHFQEALVRELSERWTLVDEPGEHVLRVRVALTDAVPASPTGNLLAVLLPPLTLASALKRTVTGTHFFVGQAEMEAEMLDSTGGERGLAVMDRRAGGRFDLSRGLSRWGQTEAALDLWAHRLRLAFDDAHDRPSFVAPRRYGGSR